jgi:apolipoprotein N-acyltransferase
VVLERSVALLDRRTPATVLGRWPELALSALALVALLASGRLRRRRPAAAAVDRPAAAPAGAAT